MVTMTVLIRRKRRFSQRP